MNEVINALSLTDITAIHGRAEDFGKDAYVYIIKDKDNKNIHQMHKIQREIMMEEDKLKMNSKTQFDICTMSHVLLCGQSLTKVGVSLTLKLFITN